MNDALIHQLHLECLGASRAERARRIQAFAELHGRAPSTVRKALADYRATRSGPRPVRVGAELEAAVRTVWRYKITEDGALRTADAQRLALRAGAIHRSFATSSLDQAAARLGLNPGAGYVRRVEAPHANYAHFVDVSGSRHFQVVEQAEGDWVLRVCRAEQRNKRWRDSELLWLCAAVDDYSRVLAMRYHIAAGETAEDVQRFLIWAWRESELQGLPTDALICDQGAFGKHATTLALMDHFGLRLITGTPHNSKRNGRVENTFRWVKTNFERVYLKTHGIGGLHRLAGLNDELQAYTRNVNASRHPVRPWSRAEDWRRSIGFRGVRECPEDALRMAVYRETRTVTAEGRVRHEGREWAVVDLPHGLRGRKLVLVYNRDGELVAQHGGSTYALRAAQPTLRGTYDSPEQAGRPAAPGLAAAQAAQRTPPSGAPLFSPEQHDAPAPPPSLPSPNLVVPTPFSQPAQGGEDPFAAAMPGAMFGSMQEAMDEVERILPRPLHALVPDELMRRRIVTKLEAALREAQFDRQRTRALAFAMRAQLYDVASGG